MDFHQPVTAARFRTNSFITSLPTNILNEILNIINQEISLKINIYRDQMLAYAREIDEKLSSCKDSRNKYYQICQQLTTKYSKLKKKYEHLYIRYQSYKGRNKELFALLQFLSSEDIRVQHNILKYQNKFKPNSLANNRQDIHILPNENSIHSHTVSPSALSSSPSAGLLLSKTHSKSKTATSIPFRNSLLGNDHHIILTNQASAVSTLATNKNYNPFTSYYNNSYKRNSNVSQTMSIHEEPIHNLCNNPSLKLRLRQSNTSPYPLPMNHHRSELEGYDDTNTLMRMKQAHAQSHGHKQKIFSNMNLNNNTPASLQPNFSAESYGFHTNTTISDIDLDLSKHQIQPVAMAASLFIGNTDSNKITIQADLHNKNGKKLKNNTGGNGNGKVKVNNMQKRNMHLLKRTHSNSKYHMNVDMERDESDHDEYNNGLLFRKRHLRDLNSMIVNPSSDDDQPHNNTSNDDSNDDTNDTNEQEHEQVVEMDNQQSNTSTLKQPSSNIEYSRSHSSSLLSEHNNMYSDEEEDDEDVDADEDEQTQTQTFYYEQLKLTPVPKKKVIDKNRLLGILQNLPNSNVNVNVNGSDFEELEVDQQSNDSIQKRHSRVVSSQMSFPDIDKINLRDDFQDNVNDDMHRQSEDEEPPLLLRGGKQLQDQCEVDEKGTQDSRLRSHSHTRAHSRKQQQNNQESKIVVDREKRSQSNGHKNRNNNNKHIRSSTFGSHDYIMCNTPQNINCKMISITGKNIKLFYRFGSKSYPPIMAKTTNTIYQLRSMIACALQNIDTHKLQLAHRGHVLNNMDLTLSQCDIAQYDTIIAKIDSTRTLFSPPQQGTDNTSSSSTVTSPMMAIHSSRPQSAKSNQSFNHFESVTPAPIDIGSGITTTNNNKAVGHRVGKKLWTPGKTPHSCSSLTTSAHPTPRRLSGIHNHNSISIQPRKSQLFNIPTAPLPVQHRHNLSEDSENTFMSYPLSPPVRQTQTDVNMRSVVADKIGALNKINAALEEKNNNNNSLRNPLFNISRPVSMRRGYNDSREYPFNVCPPSVAVSSVAAYNNNGNAPPPLPMSKQLLLLSPTKKKNTKRKAKQKQKQKKRSSRVRFSNDTKYNENTSLELRRNLSRSLDVRIDDSNNHRKHNVKSYDRSDAQFSPLPSRRRTQKLENPPLIKLLNTANCKKSKSLSLLKNQQKKNKGMKAKRRSFAKKGTKINGIIEIEIAKSDSNSPTVPPEFAEFDHEKASLVAVNQNYHRSSVDVMDPDDEERDIAELDDEQELQLERDVSREDIVSEDEISVEEYPSFNERERRKTIEIRKALIQE